MFLNENMHNNSTSYTYLLRYKNITNKCRTSRLLGMNKHTDTSKKSIKKEYICSGL